MTTTEQLAYYVTMYLEFRAAGIFSLPDGQVTFETTQVAKNGRVFDVTGRLTVDENKTIHLTHTDHFAQSSGPIGYLKPDRGWISEGYDFDFAKSMFDAALRALRSNETLTAVAKKTMFQPHQGRYTPMVDEPSPFGPEIRRSEADPTVAFENHWVSWKRLQLKDPEHAGDLPVMLQARLKKRLVEEALTLEEASQIEEPPMTTESGGFILSLAWVMWYNGGTGYNLERCHRFGLEKIAGKKRLRVSVPAEESDPFFGSKTLEESWISLAAQPRSVAFVRWAPAGYPKKISLDIRVQHPKIHLTQGPLRRLVTYEIIDGQLQLLLSEPNYFTAEDAERLLPEVMQQLQNFIPPKKKEAPVSTVPYISAEEAAEGKKEFTLGVHPSVVNAVLGEHYCKTDLSSDEVSNMLKELEKGVMGGRREFIAKFDLVCQLIGYGLHYRIVNDEIQFLVYKRNKKNGEGQLTSVFSLGTGGHAEGRKDFVPYIIASPEKYGQHIYTDIMSLEATTTVSYEREDGEELALQIGGVPTSPVDVGTRAVGFVRDSSPKQGYVGNHHFGVVYATPVPPEAEASMKEVNNDFIGWFTPQVLIEVLLLQPYASTNLGKVPALDGAKPLGWLRNDGEGNIGIAPAIEDADQVLKDTIQLIEGQEGVRNASGIDLQLLDHDFEPWSRYIIPQLIGLAEILKKKTLSEQAQ